MTINASRRAVGRLAADHSKDYVGRLAALLDQLDHSAIEAVAGLFLEARDHGNCIIFIGNGGSASTASHFAIDIGMGTKGADRPFRAISLTDNSAVLTGLANDFGYDQVFIRQLRVVMVPGDVVVAISASGNSPNIVEAISYANRSGNPTVGLTGFDGGKLREMSSTCVHVATPSGEYGLVEDVHLVVNHILTSYLAERIRTE